METVTVTLHVGCRSAASQRRTSIKYLFVARREGNNPADVKTALMAWEKSSLSPSPQSASHKKKKPQFTSRGSEVSSSQRRRWLIKVTVEGGSIHRSLPPSLQPASATEKTPFDVWEGRETEKKKVSLCFQTKAGSFRMSLLFLSQVADTLCSALNRSDRDVEISLEPRCYRAQRLEINSISVMSSVMCATISDEIHHC